MLPWNTLCRQCGSMQNSLSAWRATFMKESGWGVRVDQDVQGVKEVLLPVCHKSNNIIIMTKLRMLLIV